MWRGNYMYRTGQFVKNGHTEKLYKTQSEAIEAGYKRAESQYSDCTVSRAHAFELGFEVLSVVAVPEHITDSITRAIAVSMGFYPETSNDAGYSVEILDLMTVDKNEVQALHNEIVVQAGEGERGTLVTFVTGFMNSSGKTRNDIGKTNEDNCKDKLRLFVKNDTPEMFDEYYVPEGLRKWYTKAGTGKMKIVFTNKFVAWLQQYKVRKDNVKES